MPRHLPTLALFPLALLALGAVGCGASPESDEGTGTGAQISADAKDAGAPGGLMTADFRSWLHTNGYDKYAFPRDDIQGGSFGGRAKAGEAITHTPVVFVHGNADRALGSAEMYTGWTASRKYFQAHGYTDAELYATTWGPADELQTANQVHSRAYVNGLRAFLEAVLAYTGASKIDVVGHSMGVTLARGAILGGKQIDASGSYSIGSALTGKIDTFIGISGGNQGLSTCFFYTTTDTCSAVDGFFPGYDPFGAGVDGLATYLGRLNAQAGGEGAYRFSIWSHVDEVIGGGDLVYGVPTSRLPEQTGEVTYSSIPYGHVGAKDETAAVQFSLVTKHTATGLKKGD